MAMVECSFLAAYRRANGSSPWALSKGLALFCIHRVNRVYGALVVISWTCYGVL